MRQHTLSDTVNKDKACVHASCVAVAGRGVLIVGASGTGKSSLALRMMALGAELVADDRVELYLHDDQVMAEPVPHISGLIEARGIGLLNATPCAPVRLAYVLDMDQEQPSRLPEPSETKVLKQTVSVLAGAGVPNLAEAMIQLLKMGRVDPEWPSS